MLVLYFHIIIIILLSFVFVVVVCFEIGEICIINTYYNRSAVLKYIVLLLYEEEEGRLPRKNKNKKNNKIPVLLLAIDVVM